MISPYAALIFASCFSVVLALPTIASARSLSGKHSSGEIKEKCAAAGGVYIGASKENGGHYGCDVNGGGMVYCNKNGKCDGSDPPKRVSGTDKRPITEVLTTKPTTKGTTGTRLDAAKDRARHVQTTHVTGTGDSRKTSQGAGSTNSSTAKGPKEGQRN